MMAVSSSIAVSSLVAIGRSFTAAARPPDRAGLAALIVTPKVARLQVGGSVRGGLGGEHPVDVQQQQEPVGELVDPREQGADVGRGGVGRLLEGVLPDLQDP